MAQIKITHISYIFNAFAFLSAEAWELLNFLWRKVFLKGNLQPKSDGSHCHSIAE